MVSGFDQVSDKGLRIRQTLGLNAVYVLRKEPGPPYRVTVLATGKEETDMTGEIHLPLFMQISLPRPPLKCQRSGWLGAGALGAPESGS